MYSTFTLFANSFFDLFASKWQAAIATLNIDGLFSCQIAKFHCYNIMFNSIQIRMQHLMHFYCWILFLQLAGCTCHCYYIPCHVIPLASHVNSNAFLLLYLKEYFASSASEFTLLHKFGNTCIYMRCLQSKKQNEKRAHLSGTVHAHPRRRHISARRLAGNRYI